MADPILVNQIVSSLGLTGKEAESKRKELEKLSVDELNKIIANIKTFNKTDLGSFSALNSDYSKFQNEVFNFNSFSDFNASGLILTNNTTPQPKSYSHKEKQDLDRFLADFLVDSSNEAYSIISDYNKNIGWANITDRAVNGFKVLTGQQDRIDLEQEMKQQKTEVEKLKNTAYTRSGAFESKIERKFGVPFSHQNIESLKNFSTEYTRVSAYKEKYDNLKTGFSEVNRILQQEQEYEAARKHVRGAAASLTPPSPSSNQKFGEVLLELSNGDQKLVNEYMKKVSLSTASKNDIQKNLPEIMKELEANCKKEYDNALNGKPFSQYENQYNSACKKVFGNKNSKDIAKNFVENSKTQAAYTEIGITIATSLLLPGSSVAKNGLQKAAVKFGEKTAANAFKAGMTATMGAMPATLSTLNAATSEAGFTEEKIEEIKEKFKNGLMYGSFGAYASGPLGSAMEKILSKNPSLMSNIVSKSMGAATETTADVLFDRITSDMTLTESLEQNGIMNFGMMIAGGRISKGTNKALNELKISKNPDGTFNVKNKTGNNLLTKADETQLAGFVMAKAIGNKPIDVESRIDALSEKIYADKEFSQVVWTIIRNLNEDNIELAEKLCADKEFPKKAIAPILFNTNKDNISYVEKLCADKEFPKELLSIIFHQYKENIIENLEKLCTDKNFQKAKIEEFLSRTNKPFPKEKIEELSGRIDKGNALAEKEPFDVFAKSLSEKGVSPQDFDVYNKAYSSYGGKNVLLAIEIGIKKEELVNFLDGTKDVLPKIVEEMKKAKTKYNLENSKDLYYESPEGYYWGERIPMTGGDDNHIRLKDNNGNAFKFNSKTGELISLNIDNKSINLHKNQTTQVGMKFETNDFLLKVLEENGLNLTEEEIKELNNFQLAMSNFTPTEMDILVSKESGEQISHDIFKDSKKNGISGEYEIYSVEPNGKKYLTGLAELDKNGGKHIEKHLKSLDGTTTDTVYADDTAGNTFLHYEIKDKDGNVLYLSTKKRKQLSENHYQTTNERLVKDNDTGKNVKVSESYDISVTDDKVIVAKLGSDGQPTQEKFEYKIKDFSNEEYDKLNDELIAKIDKATTIEENKNIISQFYQEHNVTNTVDRTLLPMLSRLSGEEWAKLDYNGTKLIVSSSYEENNAFSARGLIGISKTHEDNTSVFLHEAGHESFYKLELENDSELTKIYESEKEMYTTSFPDEMIGEISYFLSNNSQFSRGRNETVAETNLVTNTPSSSAFFQGRTALLQKYFPRTIAYIANKIAMSGN